MKKIDKWNLYLSGIFIPCTRHCWCSPSGTAHNAVFNSFGSAVCKKLGALSHMAAVHKAVSAIYRGAVHKKQMTKKAKRNMLVTLGIIFTIGIIFSPVFAKVIILIVAAGHFYYFLFRIKTVEEQENMELENECE